MRRLATVLAILAAIAALLWLLRCEGPRLTHKADRYKMLVPPYYDPAEYEAWGV